MTAELTWSLTAGSTVPRLSAGAEAILTPSGKCGERSSFSRSYSLFKTFPIKALITALKIFLFFTSTCPVRESASSILASKLAG